jgi:hypothetical protein
MAMNPNMNNFGEPIRNLGELFILRRDNVELLYTNQSGVTFKGAGFVILTSTRIIGVNRDKSKTPWTAYEIPYFLSKRYEYKTPFFGSTYVKGRVTPVFGGGEAIWKLWFNNGDGVTFMNVLNIMVENLKKNSNKFIDKDIMDSIADNKFDKVFKKASSDCSKFFATQPDV